MHVLLNYKGMRFLVALLLFLLAPHLVSAAVFSFGQRSSLGQEFTVSVLLDTENAQINTVEGTILLSNEARVTEISGTDSLVNFWILRPTVFDRSDNNQEVRFAGSVPGGITGSGQRLFSLNITSISGEAVLSWVSTRALLHDGQGTQTPSTGASLVLKVLPEGQTLADSEKTLDTTPPVLVSLVRTKNKDLFSGQWALVFSARDSESGVAKYEVLESGNGQVSETGWVVAESPYLLKDQANSKTVFIRVTNNAGLSSVFSTQPVRNNIEFASWLKILGLLLALAVGLTVYALSFCVYHYRYCKGFSY